MHHTAKTAALLLCSLILCCFFSSCHQQEKEDLNPSKKKYSIYILAKDGKEYLLEIDSLSSGTIKPEDRGALLNGEVMDRDVIVHEGYYYHLSRKKASFEKYKINGKQLILVAAMPLKDFSIENCKWIAGDTLLLTGLNKADYTQVKYLKVNAAAMTRISGGDINIPHPSGKFTSISIGFTELRKDKLLIGYSYNQQLGASNYSTSDTSYVSVLQYPEMTLLKTDKDTRSTSPGGINTIQSYAFNDEKGDYYFMSCPGIALGNRPELPTGIFRINKGDQAPDKSYFFNISGSVIQNHAYGIWYLGNHKAIIRSERKDLFKGLSDHYNTAHFEFYVIDLLKKDIKKLALPLDKGTRRECIIVEGNLAYIAVNSTLHGNYIWIYNITTGTLRKGLQLAGDTDFIMRTDKLN
ncbi:hypothetical protein HDE68_001888 [Pedobacter cryoconitis]|uniref:DUF4374 domain-containing protein n=1 Tax=Pedobacter cryoconitis TaxID=188932 RepID=A0A7W8ZLF7_9SPHI|nr:hypothetical protein [Pedobacter cryoconitis]MBB5636000.1 hypothetical protein [Pedobacter cryoconitis]